MNEVWERNIYWILQISFDKLFANGTTTICLFYIHSTISKPNQRDTGIKKKEIYSVSQYKHKN